jgi:hypothetical protein
MLFLGGSPAVRCPRCASDLKEYALWGVTVKVCQGGCGGVWFERLEEATIDGSGGAAQEFFVDIERDANRTIDRSPRPMCPHCVGVAMIPRQWAAGFELQVCECPVCEGIWLDSYELERLSGLYETSPGFDEVAASEWLEHILGGEMVMPGAQQRAKLAKLLQLGGRLRLGCDTRNVSESEEWGVF